ncbi:MAG: polymer-forming cytoskeletal protein [Candidatus Phaeomarinobacter sp.]
MPDDGSKPSGDGATPTKPSGLVGAKPNTPAASTPPKPSAGAVPKPIAPAPARPTTPPAPSTPVADGTLVLGKGVTLAGHVRDATSVMVEGTFAQATIEAGELVIGPAGRINGQAVVTSAEVRGRFEGDLTVQEELNVHETGVVSGTIRYGEFQAARGARLEGDIRTIGNEPPAPTTSQEPAQPEPDTTVQETGPGQTEPEADKRGLGSMLRRK